MQAASETIGRLSARRTVSAKAGKSSAEAGHGGGRRLNAVMPQTMPRAGYLAACLATALPRANGCRAEVEAHHTQL